MGFSFWIRLYSECFRLAGGFGLRACFRFMIGRLQLDDSVLKSCGLAVGGFDV